MTGNIPATATLPIEKKNETKAIVDKCQHFKKVFMTVGPQEPMDIRYP